jgi:hypothetical protein
MKFLPPVTRKEGTAFGRQYHYYVDGDNHRIPGVTTILKAGIPKPKLINWAGRATAEGALNNWDRLSELKLADRLKELEGIRYEETDKAADKGTQIHLYAEALVQGIEVHGIPDNLRGHVENYVRFIDAWHLDPILVECVIVNYTRGYAGTLDLIADLDTPTGERQRLLLDIKTGRTGVFGETALQLQAYRSAEYYVDANGEEQPMIPVDGCAAIHVTADDAQLRRTADEFTVNDETARSTFDMFRIAQMVYEYSKEEDGLILPAEELPTVSRAHVIWDDHD